jgi:hypothetical protein
MGLGLFSVDIGVVYYEEVSTEGHSGQQRAFGIVGRRAQQRRVVGRHEVETRRG